MLRLRHPVSLLLIALLVLAAVLRSYATPAPVDAGAPDVEFSAARAEAILRDLLRDKVPHVAGSAANAAVRERIVQQLVSFGYEPRVQSLYHCNPAFGTCSPVDNVVAVKPGAVGKHAVLLTSHYDSTWAGPGAADAASGVAAILEIARMAADFPPFANDVVFLLADAEEQGLIGAHAFAEKHPLFERVKAVINLEARGVSGPSVMFETGEGNRSVIRMLSKGVERPVGNSLVYQMYRRMPNDTDFSVYRDRGLMGLNFAFAEGVALYHSSLDDPDHLDLGSLQHHGDNAWGMLKALGERDPTTIYHREDAGYIDLAGTRLAHYPLSIEGGLVLFLGVWVMLAIGLAFRKEFRYRQLRWGLVAIPLLLGGVVAGAWLLSWPLGRWPDVPPLEHPVPGAALLAVFLMLGLVIYATLKVFSGRVSACAWMILAWGLVFLLGLVLSSRVPATAHVALLPLAAFALGTLVDLLRKKSPAPLLFATVLGFAAAAYVSLYHFFMLDVVMGFADAALRAIPLWLMTLVVMPMLLAFVRQRELDWRPAGWLAIAIVTLCTVHLFLPGFTAERPRDMALMYREVAGQGGGHLVVESLAGRVDEDYAESHDFALRPVHDGRFGTVDRWVRDVPALGLPGVEIEPGASGRSGQGWQRDLVVRVPPGLRLLQLNLREDSGVEQAWVNGIPALDRAAGGKRGRRSPSLRLVYPGDGPLEIRLAGVDGGVLPISAVSWYDLPGVLSAPFAGNWPHDARPAHYGPRAEKVQLFELPPPERD